MNHLRVRKRFYIPIIITLISGYIIAAVSSNVEVHHIHKVLPVFVIYTDMTEDAGTAKGIIVLIDSDLHDDKIVLDHELIHAKQSYRYCFQQWIPLLLSDDFLARMESEAYASQIRSEEEILIFAETIKIEYNVSTPIDQIEKYIEFYWEKQKGS